MHSKYFTYCACIFTSTVKYFIFSQKSRYDKHVFYRVFRESVYIFEGRYIRFPKKSVWSKSVRFPVSFVIFMRIVKIVYNGKEKSSTSLFYLIVKLFVEILEIIRGYRTPISNLQERERAQTKIGYL